MTMLPLSYPRIDDTIQKLKMQQKDKLKKWHEGLDEVSVWVAKTRVKVESPMRLATDVDSALEQIDDFQVCCRYFFHIHVMFCGRNLSVSIVS